MRKTKTGWWNKKVYEEVEKQIFVQKLRGLEMKRPSDISKTEHCLKHLVAEAKKELSKKWCQFLPTTETRLEMFRLDKQKNNQR